MEKGIFRQRSQYTFPTRCASRLCIRHGTLSSKDGILYHDVTSLHNHLGDNICRIMPGFHALTGSDYTYPFFGRSKYGIFKKMSQVPGSEDLLSSFSSDSVNEKKIVDFVLYIVYNRKQTETTPGDSQYAMFLL